MLCQHNTPVADPGDSPPSMSAGQNQLSPILIPATKVSNYSCNKFSSSPQFELLFCPSRLHTFITGQDSSILVAPSTFSDRVKLKTPNSAKNGDGRGKRLFGWVRPLNQNLDLPRLYANSTPLTLGSALPFFSTLNQVTTNPNPLHPRPKMV